jgi:hypothetical protein
VETKNGFPLLQCAEPYQRLNNEIMFKHKDHLDIYLPITFSHSNCNQRQSSARRESARARRDREREARALEKVCCLSVLDSITSTPQWIRQPKPRDVPDVYVFVCKCALGSPKASQPLNILAFAFPKTSAFSPRLMPLRLAVGAASAFQAPPLLHSRSSPPPNGLILLAYPLHLPSSLRPPPSTFNMTT